jgi:carbonic anhydrase/acetyltransferase-like protein (isoleucine patch superfamily)
MKKYSYRNNAPVFGNCVFLADTSVLIGSCDIGDSASVWFNCVIRADVNQIKIGKNSNVQDMSMLHVTEKHPLVVGSNVTIGHSVILHGCEIQDGCLIGMGAKILDGAIIGKNSLVAAGSLVPPGKIYPEESFIMGSPAKVVRKLTPQEIEQYSNHYKSYVGYAKQYLDPEIVKEIID